MVERCVRDAEAVGSSPVTSTTVKNLSNGLNTSFERFLLYPKKRFGQILVKSGQIKRDSNASHLCGAYQLFR